jgi:hypothetical protein
MLVTTLTWAKTPTWATSGHVGDNTNMGKHGLLLTETQLCVSAAKRKGLLYKTGLLLCIYVEFDGY